MHAMRCTSASMLRQMYHVHYYAEAAGKAAQAEELRVRFEALSAQKAGLVQQLKQVHRTLHTPDRVISVLSVQAATAQHSGAISSTRAEKCCSRKCSWKHRTGW